MLAKFRPLLGLHEQHRIRTQRNFRTTCATRTPLPQAYPISRAKRGSNLANGHALLVIHALGLATSQILIVESPAVLGLVRCAGKTWIGGARLQRLSNLSGHLQRSVSSHEMYSKTTRKLGVGLLACCTENCVPGRSPSVFFVPFTIAVVCLLATIAD